MAEIVLGIGTSHSPSLNNEVERWWSATEADKRRLAAAGLGDFDELSRQKESWIGGEITQEKLSERHAACQHAIMMLKDTLKRVSPDVLVVIGDDHREVFSADHMPAIDVYWGDSMTVLPAGRAASLGREGNASRNESGMANHVYPGSPDLGAYLVESLVAQEFDISHTRGLQNRQGLGHTFDFVCRRLMSGHVIPQVPILLNTYFPPNCPTVGRCYALGKAIRKAIESWRGSMSVGIVGSGGLSHMIVNEELDREILSAMRNRDQARLTSFPEEIFIDGTSEIKAWMVLGGAMEADERTMEIIDYVPCYRTTAGTGCGMGFVQWV